MRPAWMSVAPFRRMSPALARINFAPLRASWRSLLEPGTRGTHLEHMGIDLVWGGGQSLPACRAAALRDGSGRRLAIDCDMPPHSSCVGLGFESRRRPQGDPQVRPLNWGSFVPGLSPGVALRLRS